MILLDTPNWHAHRSYISQIKTVGIDHPNKETHLQVSRIMGTKQLAKYTMQITATQQVMNFKYELA
jgi:hypothetical protein